MRSTLDGIPALNNIKPDCFTPTQAVYRQKLACLGATNLINYPAATQWEASQAGALCQPAGPDTAVDWQPTRMTVN